MVVLVHLATTLLFLPRIEVTMCRYALFTMAYIGVSMWAQPAKTPVVTGQYNNARTGSTLYETTLTTAHVNSTEFGKLYSFSVDGAVFAQPLYVPNLQIGNKTVDVLYVATMHNSIYAFDANQGGQPPLWTVNLAPSVPGAIASPCPRQAELGVLSTPVIDLSTGTIYAVGATPVSDGYEHRLYALDILTGQPKFGIPVSITAQA